MPDYYKECAEFRERERFIKSLDLSPKDAHRLGSMVSVVNQLMSKFKAVKVPPKAPTKPKEARNGRRGVKQWPVMAKSTDEIIFYRNRAELLKTNIIKRVMLQIHIENGKPYKGWTYSEMKDMKMCKDCGDVKKTERANFRVITRGGVFDAYASACKECETEKGFN